MRIRVALARWEGLVLRRGSGQSLGSSLARAISASVSKRVRPLLVMARMCCWMVKWIDPSASVRAGSPPTPALADSTSGAGPSESFRAWSIWLTSLLDSGLAEGASLSVDASRSAPTPLLSVLAFGRGLGETCFGHLPSPRSRRMLQAVMRSWVVASSSMPCAMSWRISMSSSPLLVSVRTKLAKSSAGFDGICWAAVVIIFEV